MLRVIDHSQTIKTNTFMNSTCPDLWPSARRQERKVSGSQPHPAVFFCAGALKRSGRQCCSSPKRLCRQANETFKDNLPMMVLSNAILAIEKHLSNDFPVKHGGKKCQVYLYSVVGATVMERPHSNWSPTPLPDKIRATVKPCCSASRPHIVVWTLAAQVVRSSSGYFSRFQCIKRHQADI